MKCFKITIISFVSLFLSNQSYSQCAKFEPPNGQALMIVGQDLNAIGGMPSIGYTNGYLDHVGGPKPGGYTQYTSIQLLQGISSVDASCGGHYYLNHLMSDTTFDNSVLAIGLYCVGAINDIVAGNYDANITSLANWCKAQAPRPIFLRIAYEFDYQYGAEVGNYANAWRKIVDRFRALNVDNVAFVWQSAWGDFNNWSEISAYYPGDGYVDWFGYSQWTFDRVGHFMIQEAASRGKPCMIAESAYYFNTIQPSPAGDHVWNDWFQPAINLFSTYPNLKAWALINWDWESLGCWAGWGDQRIQNNSFIESNWITEISKSKWLKSSATLYNDLNNCITGIDETSIEADPYPNPTSGVLNLGSITHWSLMDALGKPLANGESLTLDLTGLSTGIYLVRTETQTYRVVKN